MAATVKVTRNGQTTIPAFLRAKLGIKEGTILEVDEVDGSVRLRPVPDLIELGGSLAQPGRLKRWTRELDRMRRDED